MTRTALLLLLALTSCGPTDDLEEPLLPEQPSQAAQLPAQQQELTGLPCDVRAALQTVCASCHTGEVYATQFRTRAELLQLSDRVAERLSSATAPMPPPDAARQLTFDERALISRWLSDGMPAGECGGLQ